MNRLLGRFSGGGGRTREASEINVSPLIDMTFLLLIFFMVTTTFVKDLKLDIERPGARTAEASDQRSLRVTVDRSGELYVDDRPVKPWMLQSQVRERLARAKVETVLIIADEGLQTRRLVDVVDQCRLAGATNVGVAVESE